MESTQIEKDIKLFCIIADSFPEGILDAHKKLHSIIPFTTSRRYFGISRPEQGVIVYRAAAEEIEADKGKEFGCEPFTIIKGNYVSITILDYIKDPQLIFKAFEKLTEHPDIDPNGYCVEWYYNDKDVKCMVRLDDVER
jgi:hypothetical protein